MSQTFKRFSKTNIRTQKTIHGSVIKAADDVSRIARRTPALFKKNSVPVVNIRNFQAGGA